MAQSMSNTNRDWWDIKSRKVKKIQEYIVKFSIYDGSEPDDVIKVITKELSRNVVRTRYYNDNLNHSCHVNYVLNNSLSK